MKYGDDFVYIIVLNYNKLHETLITIDSCLEQNYSNYKVLLVDNNSEEQIYQGIKNRYGDRIEYLRLEKNYGYAEGNNLGVKYGISKKSKFSLILNNDVVLVGRNLLKNLLTETIKDEKIIAMNPVIYNRFKGDYKRIETNSMYVKLLFKIGILSQNNSLKSDSIKSKEIYQLHGSALLVRNEDFIKIGGFPKEYFMYNEENAFSFRAKLNGFILLQFVSDDEFVLHNHIKGKISPWKVYLMGRNFELSKSIFTKNRKIISILHFISNFKTIFIQILKLNFEFIHYYRLGIKNAKRLTRSNSDEIFNDAVRHMERI